MIPRANFLQYLMLASALFCATVYGAVISLENSFPSINMHGVETVSLRCAVIFGGSAIVIMLIQSRIWKGWRYAYWHWRITSELTHQMKDAGFGLNRMWWMDLPKIKLDFSSDMMTGLLRLQNSVKFDKRHDEQNYSAALGAYKVERHYITEDSNWYCFELIRADVSFKLKFNSTNEFKNYSRQVSDYSLFLDARTRCQLQHTLLVGQTGSGKTYALFSLILQMLQKPVGYELYFADPKGSDIAVIGERVAPNRTAIEVEDIINQLEVFVAAMEDRNKELRPLLRSHLGTDYSSFGLVPHVMIIDEYAAFAATIVSKEKKERDRVDKLMKQIILMGRQLGFFLIIVMQKSDAKLIDTALRDNIPLKVVMGNAEEQTYVTAFGNGIDIPQQHFGKGDGVFTEPSLAPTPKIVQFPILNFDILSAMH